MEIRGAQGDRELNERFFAILCSIVDPRYAVRLNIGVNPVTGSKYVAEFVNFETTYFRLAFLIETILGDNDNYMENVFTWLNDTFIRGTPERLNYNMYSSAMTSLKAADQKENVWQHCKMGPNGLNIAHLD